MKGLPAGGRQRGLAGQASVELALSVPFVCLLLLGLVQAGLVARDAVLVVHAAREAARAAAVDPRPATARAAAVAGSGLDGARMTVSLRTRGERVVVDVAYRVPTDVPLVGALAPDVPLLGTVTMRLEAAN